MFRGSGWIDNVGLFFEVYLVRVLILLYSAVFLLNKSIMLLSDSKWGFQYLDDILKLQYDKLLLPNISVLTTIAAVFVGIYFTVLSIMGSLKLNSVLAVLAEKNIQKLIFYLKSALIASFLLLFYCIFVLLISNEFIRSYFFGLLLLYMMLTALRFAINMVAVFSHDLSRLRHDIEEERQAKERYNSVVNRLDIFLKEHEIEASYKSSQDLAEFLNERNNDRM